MSRRAGRTLLSTEDRLRLILEVSDELQDGDMPWDRVNVILGAYGIAAHDPSEYQASVAETVSKATDDQLVGVSKFLKLEVPTFGAPAALDTTVRTAQPLFVFASHLAAHRSLVGAVGEELLRYGVTLFVAHDSIADDAAWHLEIEKGLDTAHAGVVFLHEGFRASAWCDQEVGWLLGRHVPVLPFNFGITPYGPLGKLQAGPERSSDPQDIAERILERLRSQPALNASLCASLVGAMLKSRSFNRTDRIWSILRVLNCDADQCAQLLDAIKNNNQVYGASSPHDSGRPYREVILEYIRDQPESAAIANDIDAYEEFLRREQAEHKAARATLQSPIPPGFASRPGRDIQQP